MFVEQADQASTMPLFDETSASVFACLSRLTDGDGRRALAVLIDVYVTVAEGSHRPRDLASITDLARRLYLAGDRSPDTVERVIADMHAVDHRAIPDIAQVVDLPEERVRTAVDSVAATSTADPRHAEMWFDDAMRAEAQLAIADRLPRSDSNPAAIGRSRRRTGVVAALAATGVLIALTMWVRSGGETDTGTPLPTVTPTTTARVSTTDTPTTAAPTTTVESVDTTIATTTDLTVPTDTAAPAPAPDQAGYILDPVPSGYIGFGAGRFMDGADGGPPYWISMWASSDAGPTSGRWLAFEVADEDPSLGLYAEGALQRVEVAGHPALMSTATTGVRRLTVPEGDGKQLQVLSFGIDAIQVAALVSATTIASDYVPTFGTGANGALDGLNLIGSAPTHQSGLGATSFVQFGAGAHYRNPDTGSFISITSAPQAPNDLRIAALLAGDSASPQTSASEMVSIDGRNVLIVTMTYDDVHTSRFALWHAGAQTISINGDLAMEDIILAVRSSRLATPDEWQALVDAEPPPNTYEAVTDQPRVHVEEIGAVTTTEGSSWTIRLSDADSGITEADMNSVEVLQLSTPGSESSFQSSYTSQLPLQIDPANPLTTFETSDATILIAAFNGPTDAAFMRVTRYRATPVDIPVVAVPESALSGAAYVFSELAPYTVELIDASGAVLQTLAS